MSLPEGDLGARLWLTPHSHARLISGVAAATTIKRCTQPCFATVVRFDAMQSADWNLQRMIEPKFEGGAFFEAQVVITEQSCDCANPGASARAAADSLARAAGRSVGELSYASVDTFENLRPIGIVPRVMAMKAEAAPAPTEEFSPHTVTVTAHVNALFSLK